MKKYKLINVEEKGSNYLITLEYIPNKFENLFGIRPKELKYYGREDGTVWHEFPSFKKCPLNISSLLVDYLREYLHKNVKKIIICK